jgi:RNA polymerase sigma-70 factor (ECF subfamily)
MYADAFDLLFKKFYPALVFFARRLTQDKPAAEDIVSDVFCKLCQQQLSFESEESAKAFLYISTRNACINYLDKVYFQSGVRDRLREELLKQPEDFVLNQIVRAEVARQMMQYVDHLPAECRKIMRMSFLQGISNREIAKQLQLSINTVRNQKARGIHLIRKRRGFKG